MPNYNGLKQAINSISWTNHNNLIQGSDVQSCLLAMINELGAGYQFAGVATEQTNPGTPDYNVFYLAGPGTYGNFGGEIIATGFIGVFYWNGSWSVGRIAVSAGGGGGAAWGQTYNNYSPLTIGAETKTIALQGHEHDFSSILGSVSGTKEDGVVVQWDASLNNGAGGWKYAVVSGGGGGGEGYLPLSAGSGNALTGTLYSQDIVPKTASNNYGLGSATNIWKNAYIENVNAGKVLVSNLSGQAADYLAYIDKSTGEVKTDSTLARTDIVTRSGAQTITGVKTFDAAPLPGGTIASGVSSVTLGNSTHRWQTLFGKYLNLTGGIYTSSTLFIYVDGENVIEGYPSSGANRVKLMKQTFVGGHLMPDSTTFAYNLGTATYPWGHIYFGATKSFAISNGTNSKAVFTSNGYDDDGQGNPATILWGNGTKASHNMNYYALRHTYYVYDSSAPNNERVVFQFGSSENISHQKLRPYTNSTYDLGTNSYHWNNLYIANILNSSRLDFYIGAQPNNDTRAFSVESTGVFSCLSVIPYTGKTVDLGRVDRLWNRVYAKAWYPTTQTSGTIPHVEYYESSARSYFKVVGDLEVEGTIWGELASDAVDLTAPIVRVVKGDDSLGAGITPSMVVQHKLLHDTRLDAQPVLMIWGKRRGRNRAEAPSYKIQYTLGRWGEARGKLATTEPLLWAVGGEAGNETGVRSISSLRTFILHQYICGKGYTEAQMRSMTLATFTSATSTLFRFGAKHNFSGTDAVFKEKTKAHRLFGIAIRYTNPEFLEAWDGSTLAETTREIDDPNVSGRKIARYIYTEVTPFRVFCHETGAGPSATINSLGLELQPMVAPHT